MQFMSGEPVTDQTELAGGGQRGQIVDDRSVLNQWPTDLRHRGVG